MQKIIMLTLTSLSLIAPSIAADLKMVKAASDHFEIYTTDNEAAARDALEHFETVRAYLLKATNATDPFTKPVRIVGFKSNGEFRASFARGIDTERAFATLNGGDVTVVINGLKKDTYEYGMREYANLFFARTAPGMPYWLRVGFRELYCTLRTGNGGVILGEQPHLAYRGSGQATIDSASMAVLLGFHASDPLYANTRNISLIGTDRNTDGVSQDYRNMALHLTRMLMFHKDYSPKFGAFVGAVSNGADSTATFEKVYGQSLTSLAQYLSLECKQASHPTVTINFQLPKPLEPQISQLSVAESAALLKEIKAAD